MMPGRTYEEHMGVQALHFKSVREHLSPGRANAKDQHARIVLLFRVPCGSMLTDNGSGVLRARRPRGHEVNLRVLCCCRREGVLGTFRHHDAWSSVVNEGLPKPQWDAACIPAVRMGLAE